MAGLVLALIVTWSCRTARRGPTLRIRLPWTAASTSACAKAAVTFCAWLIVTTHGFAFPAHAPPQPSNVQPLSGCAVRLTCVPLAKDSVHVPVLPVEHWMGGCRLLETPPSPETETESGNVAVLNVAVMARTWPDVIVHVGFDPHPAGTFVPLQPPKVAPDPAEAVSSTAELCGKLAVQSFTVGLQLIPAGLLVTVPLEPAAPWRSTISGAPGGG